MAKHDFKYITTSEDCSVQGNTKYILVGESVLGEFFGVGEPLTTVANKTTEYIQPARPASKLSKRFKNPRFATSHIHFSLNKEIVDKLIDMGARKKDLRIAHDAIIQYVNKRLSKESALIFCISSFQEDVFLEQITVVNGEVINIKESRVERFMFASQFPNHVRKELRDVSASIDKIKVCGPFLREIDEVGLPTNKETWNYAVQDDYTVEVIHPFDDTEYVDLFVGEGRDYSEYYMAVSLVVLGIAAHLGLTFYGVNGLNQAKADYRERIKGFEEIYNRGSAPIQLIEKRSQFLEKKQTGTNHATKLMRIISGVSKLQDDKKDLSPTLDRIKITSEPSAEFETKGDVAEFIITVSFYDQGKSSIELVPEITEILVSQLGAQLNVTSQPQRFVSSGKKRLRLTLEGTFCSNFNCKGA